jgi:uncharacterized membrane protein
MRLPLLQGSFWLDEAAQAIESARPLSQQLSIAEDFQPPLLHLVLHFASLVSHTEWWLRMIGAVIPGIIVIYYTYKIGKQLYSQSVGLISALLLATSSFHIFYSQELRPYSLSVVWVVVTWSLLIAASMQAKRFTKHTSVLYGVATALGLYTSYLYPFVVLSQGIYIVWKERQFLKSYLLSLCITAVLFLPWVPYMLEQLQVGRALQKSLPGWESVVAIPQLKSLPLTFGKFIFGVLNLEFSAPFLLITTTLLAGVAWVIWKNRAGLYNKEQVALYCWFLIPLITAWLVSFFIPILQPKRVIYLLPAFYLLSTAFSLKGLSLRQMTTSVWIRVVPIVLLLFINIYASFAYYITPQYQREDWRGTYQKITTQYPSDAAVIFAFSGVFAPWEWYDNTSYPVFTTGSLTTANSADLESQLKKATEYSYLLVFDYLRDLTDPNHEIEAVLEGLGYTQKDIFAVPNIGFIRVYARQEAVLS